MNETLIPSGPHDTEAAAPRLTHASIEAVVLREAYHVFPGTTLTVCCLTLRNGFHVTGESACASPAIFNAAKGEELARANAVQKIWPLEGYLLRQMLHVASMEANLAQRVMDALQCESRTDQSKAALREAFERGDEAQVRRMLSCACLIPESRQVANAELLGECLKHTSGVKELCDSDHSTACSALDKHQSEVRA